MVALAGAKRVSSTNMRSAATATSRAHGLSGRNAGRGWRPEVRVRHLVFVLIVVREDGRVAQHHVVSERAAGSGVEQLAEGARRVGVARGAKRGTAGADRASARSDGTLVRTR